MSVRLCCSSLFFLTYLLSGCSIVECGLLTSPALIVELSIFAFNYVRFSSYILVAVIVKVKVKSLSRVQFFATPWTRAYQVPPSMGFSRQKYLSGLPFPSPGDLPDPGIEPKSPAL